MGTGTLKVQFGVSSINITGGEKMEPKWLEWAKQLQSAAQAGLAYSKDIYDIERFEEIRKISVDIIPASRKGSSKTYSPVTRAIPLRKLISERQFLKIRAY